MRSRLWRGGFVLVVLSALLSLVMVTHAPPVAANFTVPFSATPVADADLDGNPATGAWSGTVSVDVPLENGASAPYGDVTLAAKHDGTYAYFRAQGKADVPWQSAAGNHFWFGLFLSPSSATGHHRSGQDGVFFGESEYTTAAPLVPVDTNGGGKPPATDASQDCLGEMRVTGTSAPYDFTAEWKRRLNTGDASDIAFVADGTTAYYLYATTDSDGGGSGGGALSHNAVTNDNVIRFAESGPPGPPPSGIGISHTPPSGVVPGRQAYVFAVLTNATNATIMWRDTSMTAAEVIPMTNLSTPQGSGWAYAAWLPARPAPTQVRYAINATGPGGYRNESYFFTAAYPSSSGVTPAEQAAWILTVLATLAMICSGIAVAYWYVGRRLRREGM